MRQEGGPPEWPQAAAMGGRRHVGARPRILPYPKQAHGNVGHLMMDWTKVQGSKGYPRRKGEPRLTVEAIPKSAHYINLRSELSKEDWNLIRKYTYQQAGYTCEICGERGKKHPVECHEIWRWRKARRVQELVRCAAICPLCHLVKHIGRAKLVGKFHQAFEHLLKVNEWTDEQGYRYMREYLDKYINLDSVRRWKLDISWAEELLVTLREEHET